MKIRQTDMPTQAPAKAGFTLSTDRRGACAPQYGSKARQPTMTAVATRPDAVLR